jgi:hypothetical protein
MRGQAGYNPTIGNQTYFSPNNFSASFASLTSLTLIGLSFIPTSADFIGVDVVSASGATIQYRSSNYTFTYDSITGVLSVSGANFNSTDTLYRVMIFGPDKTTPHQIPAEVYSSPVDFSAAWSTSSGIVLSGMPYVPTIQQFASVAVTKADGSYYRYSRPTHNFFYQDLTTSGVLNITGASFASTDLGYLVVVYGPDKGYSSSTFSMKSSEQSPLSNIVIEESLVDTTNVATGANYYPSSDGIQMLGYKNLSLSGKLITVSGIDIALETTNDEDATDSNRDWTNYYGFRSDTGTTVSGIRCSNTTTKFGWNFTDLNVKYARVLVTPNNATNTVIIKGRRSY